MPTEPAPWKVAKYPWESCSGLSLHHNKERNADLDWRKSYRDDDSWSGCPCCAELSGSDIIAMRQSEDLLAADLRNESHMNVAGRTTIHPFRDLRSAAYARKRARKFKEGGPRTRSVGGRKWWQAEKRNGNKRGKRDCLSFEIWTSQRLDLVWNLVWDIDLKEEFDEHIEDMSDDVIRYEKLHKNADVFESSAAYTETGETFLTWAQRRIAEMRSVKESRTHKALSPTQRPRVDKTHFLRKIGGNGFSYHIYWGSANTTTLPTNSYDTYAHALLRHALTPSKRAQHRARFDPTTSLFPMVYGCDWFGAYSWQWHRNASGCWQIGYGDCGDGAIPCPCCNSGNGSMEYQCYCEEFGDEPAPDEQQRCSLVEWVRVEGRRLIIAEEMVGEDRDTRCRSNDAVADSDSEWSFVGDHFGVQACSSVSSSI